MGWLLTQIGGRKTTSATSSSTPTPKPTPVPTRSDALYVYKEHQDQVFSATWSPNDSYFASAGGNIVTKMGDDKVHIWHTMTGQDAYLYQGHSKLVRKVAWSPDGTRIASASKDTTVQVWDPLTGNNIIVYSGHAHEVLSLAWSPDGTRIVSSSTGKTEDATLDRLLQALKIWPPTRSREPYIIETSYTN